MTVTTLSRTQWGAGKLRSGHLVDHAQFRGIVAHHTVMVAQIDNLDDVVTYMRRLQTARPDLGNEVPYSFVVFPTENDDDCIVAEGRGFGVTGAHTAGLNSTRYGVAYAGNASVDRITPGVLAGYRWVGRRITGTPVATTGHRDTKSTECPGNNLYALLGRIQPPFEEEDDMTDDQLDRILDTMRDHSRRVLQFLAAGQGNTLTGGQPWNAEAVKLPELQQRLEAIEAKLDQLVSDG